MAIVSNIAKRFITEVNSTGGNCIVACIKKRGFYKTHISVGFYDSQRVFRAVNPLFKDVFQLTKTGDIIVRGIHADPIAHALSMLYSSMGIEGADKKSLHYNTL